MLYLTPDNKAVANGKFFLTGKLYEDGSSIKADRLWPDVPPNLRFNRKIEEASILTFNTGTMVGDLLDLDSLDWFVTEEKPGLTPKVLTNKEKDAAGIGNFCARTFAQPIRPTWLKINLVLFPLSKDELVREHKLATHKAFPGVEFKSEEVQFCPVNVGKKWGSPFLTLLMTGETGRTFKVNPVESQLG